MSRDVTPTVTLPPDSSQVWPLALSLRSFSAEPALCGQILVRLLTQVCRKSSVVGEDNGNAIDSPLGSAQRPDEHALSLVNVKPLNPSGKRCGPFCDECLPEETRTERRPDLKIRLHVEE